MDTFFGLYFHFCFELALETLAKASLTQSLWVHDLNHTHSLESFQWSGLSDHRALHLTESCLQNQKWCPYKRKGVVPEPVCANKVRNGPASADQGFSTASQGSYHVHGTPCWNSPTSPFSTFFASRKPIFKTDYANCYLGYRVEWDIIYGDIYPRITTCYLKTHLHLQYCCQC